MKSIAIGSGCMHVRSRLGVETHTMTTDLTINMVLREYDLNQTSGLDLTSSIANIPGDRRNSGLERSPTVKEFEGNKIAERVRHEG